MLYIHFKKTMSSLDFFMVLCNSQISIKQHSVVYTTFKWLKRIALFDKVHIWNANRHAFSLNQTLPLRC